MKYSVDGTQAAAKFVENARSWLKMRLQTCASINQMLCSGGIPAMLDVTTIPMEQFPLRWRLTDPHYNVLPSRDLERIQPLDAASAGRLLDLTRPWYREQPFTQDWFADVTSISTADTDPEAIRRVRKWLFQRGIPFSHRVFLSWSGSEAAVTTWKMVVRYWDDLWYPSSDDLVVFDGSLSWALFFWHEEEAFFASRPVAAHRPAT